MDTKVLDWGQPLEAVYSDGEVKPVNCKDITKRGKDQWWVQTGPNVYLVDADTGRTADGFPTIRNVAPREVEWGPEVFVYNRKPEWLKDGEPFRVWEARSVGDLNGPCEGYYWNEVTAIVLPAGHEHYKNTQTHTYTVAPEDEAALNASPHTPTRTALEQRMEALVRRMAKSDIGAFPASSLHYEEARAILAELEPVDPEYERAEKELTELWHEENRFEAVVKFAAEQVARGRALERGEPPVTNEGAGR